MSKFSDRLNKCMDRGDFTVADLSHWFGRPFHTVWFWAHKGRTPRGSVGQCKLTYRRLELLESAIARKRGLPIPVTLTQFERPEYVEKLRHGLENCRVSARGAAR